MLAALVPAGAANAQWVRQTTFDVGAIRLTQDDFADTDGVNVAALWGRWSERVSLIASGAATRVSDGRSTGIVLGSGSYIVPLKRLRFEGGLTGTVLGTSDVSPWTSWLGFGRGHVLWRYGGVWVGGGRGDSRSDAGTFAATTTDFGAWTRRGGYRAVATLSRVNTATAVTYVYPDNSEETIRTPIGYTDASAALHGEWGNVELDAGGTLRRAWKGDFATASVGSLSAAWWMSPYVAVVGAVGRQLADPVRGTARSRFATVALRLSAERRHTPRGRPTALKVAAGETHAEAAPARDGFAVVRVRAPGARTVEIMSDLTGWRPVPLEQSGDVWVARLAASPGSHHVVVRVDGGAWGPPSNLPRIDDDFGGRVGLLVIP